MVSWVAGGGWMWVDVDGQAGSKVREGRERMRSCTWAYGVSAMNLYMCGVLQLSLLRANLIFVFCFLLRSPQNSHTNKQPPPATASCRRTRVCRPFSVASTLPFTFSCARRRSARHSRPRARVRPLSLPALLLLLVLPLVLPLVLLELPLPLI